VSEKAIGVRCKACNRTGLPSVPGQRLGSGELTEPVAHVKHTYDVNEPIAPCFQGVTRELLATCVHPGILAPKVAHVKEQIWTTEALWEL
jgi:hypothetical protein